MGVRVSRRHNADGSITKRTTVSRKNIFGNTVSDTYIEKIPRNVSRDTRKGHSLIFHLLLCATGIGFLTIPYYTLSSRHYWHL